MKSFGKALCWGIGSALLLSGSAQAERIRNPTATFDGLDKITGRITTFDVAINQTIRFGALEVTPRVCYSRSVSERPQTDAFIEVNELTLTRDIKRLFTGWMFAASPGLHAVEHPVYDVWLIDCKGGKGEEAQPVAPDDGTAPEQQPGGAKPGTAGTAKVGAAKPGTAKVGAAKAGVDKPGVAKPGVVAPGTANPDPDPLAPPSDQGLPVD